VIEADLVMEADAALEGPEDVVVLDPVALDEPIPAVIHLRREVDHQFVLRLGQDQLEPGRQVHHVRRLKDHRVDLVEHVVRLERQVELLVDGLYGHRHRATSYH
jgi:hypothetical protein